MIILVEDQRQLGDTDYYKPLHNKENQKKTGIPSSKVQY